MNPPLSLVFFLHGVESKHCLALKHGCYFDRFLFKNCCSGFSLAPLCCLNQVRVLFCKPSEKCVCPSPVIWQERSKYQFCFCLSCSQWVLWSGGGPGLATLGLTILLIHTQAGAMRIPSPARPVHFHHCSKGRAEVIPSDPSGPWPRC